MPSLKNANDFYPQVIAQLDRMFSFQLSFLDLLISARFPLVFPYFSSMLTSISQLPVGQSLRLHSSDASYPSPSSSQDFCRDRNSCLFSDNDLCLRWFLAITFERYFLSMSIFTTFVSKYNSLRNTTISIVLLGISIMIDDHSYRQK